MSTVEHEFVRSGAIDEADLKQILNWTADGTLEWGQAHNISAIGSNVGYSTTQELATKFNLKEIQIGYHPDTKVSHYLRLTDSSGERHYVEEGSMPELLSLARRAFIIGKIAVSTERGRLTGETKECDGCVQQTVHIKLCDAPYGIEGAIMANSERIECAICGKSSPIS